MTNSEKLRMFDELLDELYTLKEDVGFVESRLGISPREGDNLQSIIHAMDKAGRIMRHLVQDATIRRITDAKATE